MQGPSSTTPDTIHAFVPSICDHTVETKANPMSHVARLGTRIRFSKYNAR